MPFSQSSRQLEPPLWVAKVHWKLKVVPLWNSIQPSMAAPPLYGLQGGLKLLQKSRLRLGVEQMAQLVEVVDAALPQIGVLIRA